MYVTGIALTIALEESTPRPRRRVAAQADRSPNLRCPTPPPSAYHFGDDVALPPPFEDQRRFHRWGERFVPASRQLRQLPIFRNQWRG